MATIDLKSAYRSVMIHPSNRKFFCLKWYVDGRERYLVDNFICFGSKVAPGCFSRLTDAVVRMMRREGYGCYSYLDDFLCLGSTEERCKMCQLQLIRKLRRLGFYINWGKTTSPNVICKYLGIIIDSGSMKLSLRQKKYLKLRHILCNWLEKKVASKKELQKLLGMLSHGAKVLKGGRLYLGRLNDFLNGMPEEDEMSIPEDAKEDIRWWCKVGERPELRRNIIGEFDWNHVVVLRWGDKLSGYRNDYFRLALGPNFYFGKIIWQDNLSSELVNGMINVILPTEVESQSSVLELLLMVECVKLLKYCLNVKFCFAYRSAMKIFRSGISEFKWLRDYLKLLFWRSVFEEFEIGSVYVSRHSNRSLGHLGGSG